MFRSIAVPVFFILWSINSNAELLTTEFEGTSNITFDAYPSQEITLGPINFTAQNGNTVTYSATNSFGVAGFSADYYGLADNGIWSNSLIDENGSSYAWTNVGEDRAVGSSIKFTLMNGPTSAVGGYLNYIYKTPDSNSPPDQFFDAANFSIRALDSNGVILEEYILEDSAPIRTYQTANEGAFRGIKRDTADIYSFEIRGAGLIRNFKFLSNTISSPVPEPQSYALMIAGLAILGFVAKRRRVNI